MRVSPIIWQSIFNAVQTYPGGGVAYLFVGIKKKEAVKIGRG